MSNPRLRDPLRRPAFRRLAVTYAINELGDWMGIVALAVLVFDQTDSALATAGALPRHPLRAGAYRPDPRRPGGAAAAPLHAAGDLCRRGGGIRRPRPAGRQLLPGGGDRAGGARRRAGAGRALADPRRGRGAARARRGAAGRQRGPQRRLHRRRRGRPGDRRARRRRLRRADGAAARRRLLLRGRLDPAHRRPPPPGRAGAGAAARAGARRHRLHPLDAAAAARC